MLWLIWPYDISAYPVREANNCTKKLKMISQVEWMRSVGCLPSCHIIINLITTAMNECTACINRHDSSSWPSTEPLLLRAQGGVHSTAGLQKGTGQVHLRWYGDVLMACNLGIASVFISSHVPSPTYHRVHGHAWSSGMSEEMDLTVRALEQLIPRFFKGDYIMLYYALLCSPIPADDLTW